MSTITNLSSRDIVLLTLLAAMTTVGWVSSATAQEGVGGPYEFGATADDSELAALSIAILPDGRHLPPGQGDASTGKAIYQAQCAACHGADLKGVKETGGAALVGGRGTLDSGKAVKTVESYWPHATTVFDYVRRAMPFNAPGSLSDEEVYAVVAFILAKGGIIKETDVMDETTLPQVQMPNRDGFVPDPRPDVRNYN